MYFSLRLLQVVIYNLSVESRCNGDENVMSSSQLINTGPDILGASVSINDRPTSVFLKRLDTGFTVKEHPVYHQDTKETSPSSGVLPWVCCRTLPSRTWRGGSVRTTSTESRTSLHRTRKTSCVGPGNSSTTSVADATVTIRQRNSERNNLYT